MSSPACTDVRLDDYDYCRATHCPCQPDDSREIRLSVVQGLLRSMLVAYIRQGDERYRMGVRRSHEGETLVFDHRRVKRWYVVLVEEWIDWLTRQFADPSQLQRAERPEQAGEHDLFIPVEAIAIPSLLFENLQELGNVLYPFLAYSRTRNLSAHDIPKQLLSFLGAILGPGLITQQFSDCGRHNRQLRALIRPERDGRGGGHAGVSSAAGSKY